MQSWSKYPCSGGIEGEDGKEQWRDVWVLLVGIDLDNDDHNTGLCHCLSHVFLSNVYFIEINLIKKKKKTTCQKKNDQPLPQHNPSKRPTFTSPIHLSSNIIITSTTTYHPRNSLLHIRPLRFSRNSHISNIINVQSTITATKSSSSTLLSIPLKFVNRLESRPNCRRDNRNLHKKKWVDHVPTKARSPNLRINIQIPYIKLAQSIYTRPWLGCHLTS